MKNVRYRREWLLVGGLVTLSLALRLTGLGHVPPGVRFDELVNVKMADHIYAGEWPIYFQEAWGHEPLYHYFQAMGMSLLGKTVLGVRITSALLGALGVLTAYLVYRQLFGPATAFLAATLLTTSLWSLMYSRVGLRHISLPPWIGLSAYCFWRGLQTPADRRRQVAGWFAVGGLCVGAMLYTYFASRVVPIIYATFTLYLLAYHRRMLNGRWLGLILFFILPALVFVPMALYLREHPELEQRLNQVGGDLFVALKAGDLRPLLHAITGTLRMFSLQGDREWLYNISKRPVFDPTTSIPFYIGVLTSLCHWRDPKRAFLLLWLAIGIVPAMLSWPPGSMGHTIAAQPAVFGFPALALVASWRWARAQRPRWARWSVGALAAAVVLTFALHNGYDYFVRWPRFPQVRHEYQAPITAVARYLKDRSDLTPACISAPYVDRWNPWSKMNFDLYYQGESVRVCWFNGTNSILFPGAEEASFFLPDHILLPSELDADLSSLLMAGAEPVELGYQAQNGSTFDLYRWQDPEPLERRLQSISTAPVWASPEGPYAAGESEKQRQGLSLPIDFGGRLSLLGYSYDRTRVAAGEAWRVTTYWRVLETPPRAGDDTLAIFVHVLNDANQVRAGWDGLHVPPAGWREGDVFIHIHALTLPSDMPPGAQRVELGVYSPITLHRLQLLTGDGSETAPHDRALLSPLDVQDGAEESAE